MTDVQRFTELTGGKWKENEFVWEDDKTCVQFDPNSTYSTAESILNRMKEYCGQSKYNKFLWRLGVDCVGEPASVSLSINRKEVSWKL